MLKLHVAGWMGVPHSYALVNEWQLLALLQRRDLELSFSQAPLLGRDWSREPGLFAPQQAAALSAIAGPSGAVDVEYRIFAPMQFGPGDVAARRILAFSTTEFRNWPADGMPPLATLLGVNGLDHFTLVTPSEWSRAGFLEAGVREDKVVVVPLGVDTELFRPDPARRAATREALKLDGVVFLNIGAMTRNKGTHLLLEAFGAVLERGHRATLVLKGLDTLYGSRQLVERLASNMPAVRRELVLKHLVYVGRSLSMAEIAGLHNAADCYVSPYHAEGFNMPVLEAAASGLPLIVTDGGPTDEFTDPGFCHRISSRRVTRNAMTVLDPSFEHLVELISAMVGDDAFRQRAASLGPAHVSRAHRWDSVVDQLVGLAASSA